jgi:hypothetical protein
MLIFSVNGNQRLSLQPSDEEEKNDESRIVKEIKRQKMMERDILEFEEQELTENFSKEELEFICSRAFLAEKLLHGNPSGWSSSMFHLNKDKVTS